MGWQNYSLDQLKILDMEYNRTHDEYRIGLNLAFKLKFGHPDNPKGWICLSNIPGINQKKLQAQNKVDAGYEVMALIQSGLNFEYRKEIFNQ